MNKNHTKNSTKNKLVGIWEKDHTEDKDGYTNNNHWNKLIVSFDMDGNSIWTSIQLFDVKLVDGTTETRELYREVGKGELNTNERTYIKYIITNAKGVEQEISYFIDLANENRIDFIEQNGDKIIFKRKMNFD